MTTSNGPSLDPEASVDNSVPTAHDFPDCLLCQEWEIAGASWPRPCAKHYGGEPS